MRRKFITEKNSLKFFEDIKSKNKKTVFTNGCFDIIHPGHIHLLKESKKLGDILIVGLNSDKSIKLIKGDDRPIVNENDRVKILESIKYVDNILIFEEETPINLIKLITPDVLVKGGDYLKKDIVGSDFILENGGTVKTIPLIEGISTTSLIKGLNPEDKKHN